MELFPLRTVLNPTTFVYCTICLKHKPFLFSTQVHYKTLFFGKETISLSEEEAADDEGKLMVMVSS